MQCVGRFRALLRSLLALHVQGNPSVDVALGPNAVDVFLHFAVAAVAAFHGIGCGWQQFVVKERERLLQVGREQFLQCLANLLEATNPASELGQLFQRGVRPTAAIEQTIDLIHDVA